MIYTAEQLKKMWNDEADEFNQWETLDDDEKLVHAQQCVIDRTINVELAEERDSLKAINAVLVELLKEAADEIWASVEAQYPKEKRHYPVMQRRYDRDMEIVQRINALIARQRR